jgi:class 3 adenylate cyclase/tetratricopeptide (TPR) repeat protein
MRCAACGAESPEGKRFCADCGVAFPVASANVALGAAAPPPSKDSRRFPGERRHITVLFSDLVNSTLLAAGRDPEEWQSILTGYQREAGEAVLRQGGHIAKYLGDGVVAYFGWPTANEDDAERAVRAGLAIVDAIATLSQRFVSEKGVELAVRVGIDSGSVVIGEGASGEVDIFGDVPNIASRVQAKSAPNTVLITGALHELVSGRFIVEDYGAHALAGIERPLQLFRAVQPSGVRRRWRRGSVRGLTPFVGRESELDLLRNSWASACQGMGQFVLVTGESGIGKSRLIEEFHSEIKDSAHLWVECAGERFFKNTPFHVVTEVLEQAFGWYGDESAEKRSRELERALGQTRIDLPEALPLIAEMLKLPASKEYPHSLLAPKQARSRLLACLATWALDLARLQPVVIVIDDLHWVDPSTLELARMLVEQTANARLMLVGAAWPGFRPPWEMRANRKGITLARLSDDQIRDMIASFSNHKALTGSVVDSVVERSDGVPIFAEELVSFIQSGKGRLVAKEIPSTLLDSLTARLDRLGPPRRVAQVAAVLGREFAYPLLRTVVPGSDEEVQSALRALVEAELIYTQGKPPNATYQFKHALIQNAAYEGLLKKERRELHGRVARTIRESFAALAEAQPGVLAHHWTEAGEAEPAIAAWKAAGDTALARRAFNEAEEDYRQASALLKGLPQSAERDGRELDLCSALVRVLQVTRGYSAPETVEWGERVRILAEKLGDLSHLIRQQARTWAAIFVTGDYATAGALAEQILELALIGGQNTGHLVFAHNAQVQARFYTGDLVGLEEHFARLSPLINTAGPRTAPGDNIIPIGVASLAAWSMGRAECARERIERALRLAEASHDPYDMAMALHFECNLYRSLRKPLRTEAIAARLLSLSEMHGFRYASDLARFALGLAKSDLGRPGEGVGLIRQALAGFAAAGAKVAITFFLTGLAEAQARDGATELALRSFEDALTANPLELFCRPYTLISRGELRLKMSELDSAEVDFRDAFAQARKMGAKSWELRAATSLASLLEGIGNRGAARDTLAPIYSGFSEGFETADLKDAKALLDQLGA